MTPPSFAPVRALPTFVGSWISAHFLNPLILGFIDLPMTVFLYKISGLEALIGRDCHDHQDDKKTGMTRGGTNQALIALSLLQAVGFDDDSAPSRVPLGVSPW
jgi:hypothetical protein